LKNQEMVISAQWFDRSAWNLAQWRTLTIQTVSAVKRYKAYIVHSVNNLLTAMRPFVKILLPLFYFLVKILAPVISLEW